jgi:HSP20 family protein
LALAAGRLLATLADERREGRTMGPLADWDPFRSLRRRTDFLETPLRDVFVAPAPGGGGGLFEPPAEVAESKGEVTIRLEVPGVDKDQLTIAVDDDLLTVRGEVRRDTEETDKSFYRQEIRYGAFQRSLPLPAEVDAERAKAELKNGILKITLPKSQQPRAHQIKIAGA